MINAHTRAIPGYTGGSSGHKTEPEARAAAYDYAQLLLGNDDKRRHVEVDIAILCWACDGSGSYSVSRKKVTHYFFDKRKPCAICSGFGEFPLASYSVTRE